jgi:hypothetical protein
MGRRYSTRFRTWKPSRDKLIKRAEAHDTRLPIAEDATFDQLCEICRCCLPWTDVVFVIFEYIENQERHQRSLTRILLDTFSSVDIISLILAFLLWIDVDSSDEDDASDEYISVGEFHHTFSPTRNVWLERKQDLGPLHTRSIFHCKTSPKRPSTRLGNGRPKQHSRWSYTRLHKRVWMSQELRLLAHGLDPMLNKQAQKRKPRSYSRALAFFPSTFRSKPSRPPRPRKQNKQFVHLNNWKRTYRDPLDEIC